MIPFPIQNWTLSKADSLLSYKKYHHWCECYPGVNRSPPAPTEMLFMSLFPLTPKLLKHHKNFYVEKESLSSV